MPAIRDHKESWELFKESKGKARCHKGLHLFALWFVAVFSLIGTLFLGFESITSDRKDVQRDTQYRDVTNRLDQTESEYNEATNDLAAAKRALKPKTLQERLVDCLNTIDPRIINTMAKTHRKMDCHGSMSESQYEQLEKLAAEPGAAKYISKITWNGGSSGSVGMSEDVSFEVEPLLLQ